MSMDNLADAFHHGLQDIFGAEKQMAKALPKLVKSANCEKLTKAFEDHLKQTKSHIERVEKAFADTGKPAKAKTCDAMKGLIEETEGLLKEKGEPAVMDAMLIGAAQKVEHYEIATYGTLCTWADALGYSKASKLLKQNMGEEEKTDSKLNKLAEKINKEALACNA